MSRSSTGMNGSSQRPEHTDTRLPDFPYLDPEYRNNFFHARKAENQAENSRAYQVGDQRSAGSPSSGSDRSSNKIRQPMLDKWRLDQRQTYRPEEAAASPVRAYSSPQRKPTSPTRPKMSSFRPAENSAQPAIDLVGELFNFTQPANLAPKYAAAGPMPKELPSWSNQRMYQNGRFLYNSALENRGQDEEVPLASCSTQAQSAMIVDDLLNTFEGLQGRYIKVQVVKRAEGLHLTHVLQCEMDPPLRDMARTLLPLSEYAAVIERFVETRSAFEWGLVCHALTGAMRNILSDWHLLITQLEHKQRQEKLDLPTLAYHCHQPLNSLRLVASLAGEAAARKLRGAALLNLLYQKSATVVGNVEATAVVQRLLEAASQPYFSMLELWLCQGLLNDPFAEFMVEEDKSIGREDENDEHESSFWTDRYKVRMRQTSPAGVFANTDRKPDIPAFLNSSSDLILTTGKYLNIIRECGREVKRPLANDVHIKYNQDQSYLHKIKAANKAASSAVMDLMLKDIDLTEVLQALKHYFLIDRGDLLESFLDSAEEEMAKPLHQVSLPRLQTLLDLAVRSSSGVAEAKGEELFCAIDTRRLQPMLHDLAPAKGGRRYRAPNTPLKRQSGGPITEERGYALATQLGREVFMLGFKIHWPVNIIVSRSSMSTYQLIFRHLFELKCVERELSKVWKTFQRARSVASHSEGGLKLGYGLCQRMMHFFHQYLLYITFEVLEPNWLALVSALKAANTLEEVMDSHRRFLQRSLACTILKSKMVRNLTELKVIVYDFSREVKQLNMPDAEYEDLEYQRRTGRGQLSEAQKRRDRSDSCCSRILDILEEGNFLGAMRSVDTSFNESYSQFIRGLEDVLRNASGRPDSSIDELESLQNLITRLDFNGYFATKERSRQSVQAAVSRLRR